MRRPITTPHPGFERAGLRRRDMAWIRAQATDAASVVRPGMAHPEPGHRDRRRRAARDRADGRRAHGRAARRGRRPRRRIWRMARLVFLGVIDERPHFAVDLSHTRRRSRRCARRRWRRAASPAPTCAFADLRQLAGRLARPRGRAARLGPRDAVLAFAAPLLRRCAAARPAARKPGTCAAAPTPPARRCISRAPTRR